MLQLRPYISTDLLFLMNIFYETVHTVCAGDYTPDQLDAWAPTAGDSDSVHRSILHRKTLVAEDHGTVLGFGNIGPDGYLDMLYVASTAQGQGVATALCDKLESLYPVARVTVHASKTALPFFEKRGYRVICPQEVLCHGQVLTNYRMEKERF